MEIKPIKSACDTCAHFNAEGLKKLGINVDNFDFVVALAGNPNTGKSTVFNALTGLRQHTGNWPGKTVTRAEGGFQYNQQKYKLVDLPGTYSLLSTSTDEEVARDFILFGRPDVTIIVADANRLERNLNLVLQILEITDKAVLCLNLMDEAKRNNIVIDQRTLAKDLGIPVVATSARYNEGIPELIQTISEVANGTIVCKPHRIKNVPPNIEKAVNAATIVKDNVQVENEKKRFRLDSKIDKIVTSKTLGFPIMFLILGVVLWLTIIGANYPSSMLANLFLDTIHPALKGFATSISMPWWLDGFLIDGVYLAVAWVIAVMLPPMAIFFPMFTLLEDFGYLPRVAFNLDNLFKKSGAHGKQALTMSMGFGCNAAGVVATRIIDSPRERLIAIITNNFSLCNGRWPTQILIATIFIGAVVPSSFSSVAALLSVIGIAVLGMGFMFLTSWALSKTVLKGEVSTFILLAYIVAIPANEIVIPTILMLTVLVTGIAGGEGAGVMFELDSISTTGDILKAGGWTLLTAINLMLFSLLHNPCSTTIYTIYKETKSTKWTLVASILPVILGFIVTFLVAQIWRLF